jgi:hypothetical protein
VPHEQFNAAVESIRTRVQAELDAQLTTLAARYEDALATARQEAEADASRRIQEAVGAARREVEAEAERRTREAVEVARREVETDADRRISAMAPAPSMNPRILESMSAIDEATSVSAMLNAVSVAASAYGAALYVGPGLERWPAAGAASSAALAAIVSESFATRHMIRRDGAMAAPVLLDGSAIGVLHAPSPSEAESEAIDIIARYAAARLGLFTATRTLQARRWITPSIETVRAERSSERKAESEQAGDDDDAQSARRYARLLVSEIKLYNETAVNEGRAHRDLSRRLGGEIDRARRLYEERVPATIEDRARHFHHELIQTLAGGDPTLLG